MFSGILYYPFEILIDFLNRVTQISNNNTAIIRVPEFSLDFFGNRIIIFNAINYDFNSLLTNDTFKTVHDFYLIFVDIILWLGLVYLAQNCLKSILGGMSNEISDQIYESQSDERDYSNYVQHQKTKERYRKEHGGG